jgi:hypothetical protein
VTRLRSSFASAPTLGGAPPLLTRQEAAASLGMSVDTFERRVQPFIKVVPCGQLVLVPPPEIERWIKADARYLVDQVA